MALDSQREDIPRISVETLDDWRRIKRNYTRAALAALDEQLSPNDSQDDRQLLLAHLHRVRRGVGSMSGAAEQKPNHHRLRDADDARCDERHEQPIV